MQGVEVNQVESERDLACTKAHSFKDQRSSSENVVTAVLKINQKHRNAEANMDRQGRNRKGLDVIESREKDNWKCKEKKLRKMKE